MAQRYLTAFKNAQPVLAKEAGDSYLVHTLDLSTSGLSTASAGSLTISNIKGDFSASGVDLKTPLAVPSSPAQGHIWQAGNELLFRDASTSKTLMDLNTAGQTISAAKTLGATLTVSGSGGVNASGAPDGSGVVIPTSSGAPTGANTEGCLVWDTSNDVLYAGLGGTSWQQLSSTAVLPNSSAAGSVLIGNGSSGWTDAGTYHRLNADGSASFANGNFDISTAGNVTDGTWQADAIATQYGGTGQNWSATATNSMVYFTGTGTMGILAPGTDGYFLKSVSGAPTWSALEVLPTGTTTGSMLRWDGADWVETTYLIAGSTGSFLAKILDNSSTAFVIENATGGNDFLVIDTTTGSKAITIGNATDNNTVSFLGTGQKTMAGNLDVTNGIDVTGAALTTAAGFTASGGSIDLDPTGTFALDMDASQTATITIADALDASFLIKEGANNYLEIDTQNGTEIMNFGNATTNPDYSFLGTGQTTISGNVDVTSGLDVTGASLTVGGSNFVVNTSGQVTAGTWQGGTIAVGYGGTGLTTVAAGSLLYGAGTSPLVALAIGTSGYFLKSNGSIPGWAQVAWLVDCDSGGPKTIADGNTLDIAGGNGISTVVAGVGSPFTITVTADVDNSTLTNTGGGGAQLAIKTDGVNTTHIDWGSTGNQVDSSEVPVDTAFTAVNYTPPGTYTGVTNHLDGIDVALGLLSAGLIIVGNTWLGNTANGIIFDNTDGIRQYQAVILGTTLPSINDTFVVKSTAGTETWTFKASRTGAYEVTIGADENEQVNNLFTAIITDSTDVYADWDILDDLQANRVLLLGSLDANNDHRTYFTTSGGFAPKYSSLALDSATEFTTLPTTDPVTTNWALAVTAGSILTGQTWVMRAGDQRGAWMTGDNTGGFHWVESRPHVDSYAPGDGIMFTTQAGPDLIEVDLATNSGLTFSSGQLLIDLDGGTLQLGVNGISLNLNQANVWTAAQTFGADAKFLDNDNATFGTGSDMQIVHDGTDTYISNLAAAAGDLIIENKLGGLNDLVIQQLDTTVGSDIYVDMASTNNIFHVRVAAADIFTVEDQGSGITSVVVHTDLLLDQAAGQKIYVGPSATVGSFYRDIYGDHIICYIPSGKSTTQSQGVSFRGDYEVSGVAADVDQVTIGDIPRGVAQTTGAQLTNVAVQISGIAEVEAYTTGAPVYAVGDLVKWCGNGTADGKVCRTDLNLGTTYYEAPAGVIVSMKDRAANTYDGITFTKFQIMMMNPAVATYIP